MEKTRFDFIFKIVFVGDAGCGKTTLISRYVDDAFLPGTLSTIGVDFKLKTITVGKYKVKLQLWDTAGQERYASIGEMYYRGASAAVVVYDITRESTFKNIPKWINRLQERGASVDEESKLVIVGCKGDLDNERQVSRDAAQRLAIEVNSRWTETSGKSGSGVEEMFSELAGQLVDEKTRFISQNCDMSQIPSRGVDIARPQTASNSQQRTSRISVKSIRQRFSAGGRRSRQRSVISGNELGRSSEGEGTHKQKSWCLFF